LFISGKKFSKSLRVFGQQREGGLAKGKTDDNTKQTQYNFTKSVKQTFGQEG
jgi:hypothetical protein